MSESKTKKTREKTHPFVLKCRQIRPIVVTSPNHVDSTMSEVIDMMKEEFLIVQQDGTLYPHIDKETYNNNRELIDKMNTILHNGYVYAIKVIKTNRVYIGITSESIPDRLGRHQYSMLKYHLPSANAAKKNDYKLYKALDSGLPICDQAIVYQLDHRRQIKRAELAVRETYWINKFQSRGFGYNKGKPSRGRNLWIHRVCPVCKVSPGNDSDSIRVHILGCIEKEYQPIFDKVRSEMHPVVYQSQNVSVFLTMTEADQMLQCGKVQQPYPLPFIPDVPSSKLCQNDETKND